MISGKHSVLIVNSSLTVRMELARAFEQERPIAEPWTGGQRLFVERNRVFELPFPRQHDRQIIQHRDGMWIDNQRAMEESRCVLVISAMHGR